MSPIPTTPDPPLRPFAPRSSRPPAPRLTEEFVGGQLLAWAGGAALLVALGTLFWLGVRDGWIGEPVRCLLGAVASSGLLAAGLRHARHGRAREASWAMAGTGLAGLYVTSAVAAGPYDLLPPIVGLALLAGLGVAAAWTAIRWESQPLAGVGLLGALGAPLLAPVAGLALPVVVLALGATGLLVRQRPWTWLTALATALALPQVAWHVVELLDAGRGIDPASPGALLDVAAPGLWTVAALAAGLLLGAGWEIGRPAVRERDSMPLLVAVHALIAAALASGYALIGERPVAAALTLAAVAGLLAAAGWSARRRAGAATPVELVLLGLAVLVADLGFALVASGVVQLLGWAVTAVAFALVARRAADGRLPVVVGGVGLHVGLGLIEVVGTVGDGGIGSVVGAALLAAACAVSARVIEPRSRAARLALDATALAVAALWTAVALDPAALALACAAQAAALALAARHDGDPVARLGGLAHLAVAGGLALVGGDGAVLRAGLRAIPLAEVPTTIGPLAAAAGAALLALWTLRGRTQLLATPLVVSRVDGDQRLLEGLRAWLAVTGGSGALVAASGLTAALVTAAGGGPDAVAVALDALWAGTAIGLVAAGLLRRAVALRIAGLALLGAVAFKVAVIDLAEVDTAGRVVAWAVLGALLLVGAGLYGRLRPVAPPTAQELEALEREVLER